MRTRRSIVFQLWLRLSLIVVSFTLIALTFYLGLIINDRIDAHPDPKRHRSGIAHYPADGTTSAELLGVADRRMYEEKSWKSRRAPSATAV
jgi:hypothetical protein